MRTWVKGTAPAALLALGVMTLGSGTAFADTSGDHSIGGGNQVMAPITLPIDISGNAVAVAGGASAASRGGASADTSGDDSRGSGGNTTSGRGSVLGGNQVTAPITAPINACGNAVALFGGSEAGCRGGASVSGGRGGRGSGGNTTSGRGSVLGGNQVVAPITAPINVCGNSVAAFGGAFSGCRGGAEVSTGNGPHRPGYHGRPGRRPGTRPGSAGGNHTEGRFSAGGGNQVVAPITAPINVCGNAVGNADAACAGRPSTVGTGSGAGAGGNTTSGRWSVLGGNQVVAPITAPINVCGNAVAVLGDAAAGCLGGSHVGGPGGDRRWMAAPAKHEAGGLVPELPVVPALKGAKSGDEQARRRGGSGVPALSVVKEARDTAGLPEVPAIPVSLSGKARGPMTPQAPAPARAPKGNSPLDSAADLVSSTPVGGALPIGDIGLMSAAQPVGVTGMNSGSLFALALGAMAAASAALFALTRRMRYARR